MPPNPAIAPPEPRITPWSQPYWDGLAAGRFIIQRCGHCATPRHYPQPLCRHCLSAAVDWVEVSGTAQVHSWTVVHHAYHPAFRTDVPFTLVTADLPEGVRVLARLVNPEERALHVGLPLRLMVARSGQGYGLPLFVINQCV